MLIEHAPAVADVTIDGRAHLTRELVALVQDFCDRVEDAGSHTLAVLRLFGAPADQGEVDVALVSKWERALRRVERLSATTAAVVTGECGGLALEALLTADYRVGTADTSLVVPVRDGTAWPGMLLYRLANQVGVAAVRRAVIFGQPVGAAQAVSLGLLDLLAVDEAEALAEAVALLGADGAESAIRRQLLLEATTTTFEDALGRHLAACDRALRRAVR